MSYLNELMGFLSHVNINNYYNKSQINYYDKLKNAIGMVYIYEKKEGCYYRCLRDGFPRV